jgi:hypothetical protein
LEPEVIIGIHKHRVGIHLTELRIVKREDPLNDHHIHRFNALRPLGISAMKSEVIDRSVHGVPISKSVEVMTKKLRFIGVRVIVISDGAFL